MLDFTQTFEDGDYQVFRSTNHSDPNRIAFIVIDHEGLASYPYGAFVEDESGDFFTQTEFCDSWDKAKKFLECEVTHKLEIAGFTNPVYKASR